MILSWLVIFYLAGVEHIKKVVLKADGVFLTGFATCIAYGSLIFGVWRKYGLEEYNVLKGFAILMYTLLIISQVCHIRAMVNYFPWNNILFHIYKGMCHSFPPCCDLAKMKPHLDFCP